MKATINLLGMSILLSFFIVGCGNDNAEDETFLVEITNKGTSEIIDIELSMEEAEEEIKINTLAVGQTSGYQTFILPTIEGPMPDSWGDYSGKYTQRDTIKEISILNYEHKFRIKMRIEIEDRSYITIYP